MIHYNGENLEELMKDKKVVIDFFATWCGPCRMFAPVFELAAEKNKEITFIKLDIDEHESVARNNKVMSVPTVILFENGKEINRNIGFMSETDLDRFIK